MRKLLSVLLSLMLLCSALPALAADAPLTRAQAAVLLDDLFALADVHALNIPTYETMPKNMGYTASNGAIVTANVIPAAKDCVQLPEAAQIEAVLNAGMLSLGDDQLTFAPALKITAREFLTAIAKGVYGPDLAIDHLQKALDDGLFTAEQVTDDALTEDAALAIKEAVAQKITVAAVFVTSDIHGNYIPYTSSDGNFTIGSVARIKTIVNEVTAQVGEENVLLVDGGDSPYNTTLANVTNGDVSVAALNALGLDITVLGNHDFDYSLDNLVRLAGNANYVMSSLNTIYKEGHRPADLTDGVNFPEFNRSILETIGGLKVSVFGLTDEGSAATTLYSNTVDITWRNALDMAKNVAMSTPENPKDVVILLSHLHSANKATLEAVPEIKISIGGGNDIAGKPTIVGNDQYLINPGKHGEAVTQLNLIVLDGKLSGIIQNQIFLTEAYEEDAEVKAVVDSYNAQVDAAMDTTIGYNAQNLEWSSELVRCQNSPIANLVSDALLWFFKDDGAQICIVNGGGIRAKLNEGAVSIRNVNSVLPFDNNMMLVETSGQTIWDALQNGISAYPATNGKFPQVSGMTYAFTSTADGNKITAVTLSDGTALDLTKTYKVVINSFLAGGGDGYTMLNVLDTTKEMAKDVTQLVYVNKTYMRDALLAYIEANSTEEKPLVVDTAENRIEITK